MVNAVVNINEVNLKVPVSTRLMATFNNIHRHKSCIVDTVKTILEKFVFIISISKKILEITGIEVMATEITNTITKDALLFAAPIKFSSNILVNKSPKSIGITVAPKNSIPYCFAFFFVMLIDVLKPEENMRNTKPN